jgi:DUF3047 family protein
MGKLTRTRFSAGLLALFASSLLCAVRADTVMVGNFSAGEISGWDKKAFKGETEYRIVELDGRRVLRAKSQASASGLVKLVKVDLTRTPILHWSWRVDNVLKGVNERSRQGDDYPARIYPIVSGGAFFWKTRSLIYVWSSYQPAGTVWHSAYTGNAVMVAVQSGEAQIGRWLSYKRDVRADLKDYFGEDIETIDALAIMTDTDNSGQSAVAYYGDIYFSSE